MEGEANAIIEEQIERQQTAGQLSRCYRLEDSVETISAWQTTTSVAIFVKYYLSLPSPEGKVTSEIAIDSWLVICSPLRTRRLSEATQRHLRKRIHHLKPIMLTFKDNEASKVL